MAKSVKSKTVISGQEISRPDKNPAAKIETVSAFSGTPPGQTTAPLPVYELIRQKKMAEMALYNLTREALVRMEAIMAGKVEKQ